MCRVDMCTKAPLKVVLYLGSTRDGRMCSRVSAFITEKLREAGMTTHVLDPLELNLPLLKQPLHFYPNQSEAPRELHAMNEIVKSADAYLLVAAEYNRQMPPALTNLIDYLPPRSYAYKASAIVSYSLGHGGMNSAAQARTLMVELGAPPIPFVLHIGQVANKLSADGKVASGAEYLNEQADKLIKQLTWYASAMRNHRKAEGELEWIGPTMSV